LNELHCLSREISFEVVFLHFLFEVDALQPFCGIINLVGFYTKFWSTMCFAITHRIIFDL